MSSACESCDGKGWTATGNIDNAVQLQCGFCHGTGVGPMKPNPNWLVTVQAPQEGGRIPGYVQIDDVTGGENRWSKGPETLRAEGFDIPNFAGFPSGQYRFCALIGLLEFVDTFYELMLSEVSDEWRK